MRNPTHRCKPLPVSRVRVQVRAIHEAQLNNILDFKASDGWFRNWRERTSIKTSIRLTGEAGDVNPEDFFVSILLLNNELSMQTKP